jgi:hypothetical protein
MYPIYVYCSDWSILEYEYKNHAQKFYDQKGLDLKVLNMC